MQSLHCYLSTYGYRYRSIHYYSVHRTNYLHYRQCCCFYAHNSRRAHILQRYCRCWWVRHTDCCKPTCGFDGQVAVFFWIRSGHGTSNPDALNRKLWALSSANVDLTVPKPTMPSLLSGQQHIRHNDLPSDMHSLRYTRFLPKERLRRRRSHANRPFLLFYGRCSSA